MLTNISVISTTMEILFNCIILTLLWFQSYLNSSPAAPKYLSIPSSIFLLISSVKWVLQSQTTPSFWRNFATFLKFPSRSFLKSSKNSKHNFGVISWVPSLQNVFQVHFVQGWSSQDHPWTNQKTLQNHLKSWRNSGAFDCETLKREYLSSSLCTWRPCIRLESGTV